MRLLFTSYSIVPEMVPPIFFEIVALHRSDKIEMWLASYQRYDTRGTVEKSKLPDSFRGLTTNCEHHLKKRFLDAH